MRTLVSIVLGAAMANAGFASVETLWAQGVSQEKGWYDFNKAQDGSQSGLCWAITASHLIAWWQSCQREDSLPAAVPRGESVWKIFQKSFSNEGSDPDQAMRWWFSGLYEPAAPSSLGAPARIICKDTGAYYVSTSADADAALGQLLYSGRGSQVTAQTLTKALYEGFRQGHAFWIGVAYYRSNGLQYTHALTVWGVDYELNADLTPRITAIYMADSDDGLHHLHRIPVKEDGGMLVFDCPEHPLYGKIGVITIDTYTGMKNQAPGQGA